MAGPTHDLIVIQPCALAVVAGEAVALPGMSRSVAMWSING